MRFSIIAAAPSLAAYSALDILALPEAGKEFVGFDVARLRKTPLLRSATIPRGLHSAPFTEPQKSRCWNASVIFQEMVGMGGEG
eukprot:1677531-Pyramimonas_sp.AAC.1